MPAQPKSNAMSFGFPYPRYKESRTFDLVHDELLAVVESAWRDLDWPYKILWGRDFEVRIPTTNWSWHHDFKVAFPASGVIEAESKSAYQEMFFDFGRNRRNVSRFFAHVEQLIKQQPP